MSMKEQGTNTESNMMTYEKHHCDFRLNILKKRGVDIQKNMYGLFFEDINYAADGGLYAELVENRSFEQVSTIASDGKMVEARPGYAWSAVDGSMEYKKSSPLNANNPTYLEFKGRAFKNQAYQGMYIEKNKRYKVSFYARSQDFMGAVAVRTEKNGRVGFSGIIADKITNTWERYEKELTAADTVRYSDFIIELTSFGTVDFDMISVMPSDAINGVYRRDLAEMLKEVKPGFLRFPGGCVVEGYDLSDRYQWKKSVGPIEERVQNWNRWAAGAKYPHYNQTLGLGFFEYFELCEYLGCDALPVLSVGIPCEYQGGNDGYAVPMYNDDGLTYTDEFYEYIRDALDLVEFANGIDFENSEWAALRRSMGHEKPFGLTMIGVGNEQWRIGDNKWYERYEAFEREIHKVYPDIKLISTSGPSSEGPLFDEAWSWIRENQSRNNKFTYAVDEHYYMSHDWFLTNDKRYDGYDRETKVFAGEYAVKEDTYGNTLYSAIAEAAFMTGLERNADCVYMASYAPLLARIGYNQWHPDMIWFDDMTCYGSPDYYVQRMYANNNGDYTLQTSAECHLRMYYTVSYSACDGDIIVKIVNPYEHELKTCLITDECFILTGRAAQEVLTGKEWTDTNSITEPENITSVKTEIDFENGADYILPAKSFTVLRIHVVA